MPSDKLILYNTLTRTKDVFVPIDPKNVRMYVCGPTVYGDAHIGNARPVIAFDLLFRLLRFLYGSENVIYVRNITDIDDKINAYVTESDTDEALFDKLKAFTRPIITGFHDDAAALGTLPPSHAPRATEFVDAPEQKIDMLRMIAQLLEKDHAYVAEGHVLFDSTSDPRYGRLSRLANVDLQVGMRVEIAPYKKKPTDFVLWKPSTTLKEPGWHSPWGYGRPGWHIECSAMSSALLGDIFDLHAGGLDLIFPHHENEIAQSQCFHGQDRMANFWLHNGFVLLEGQKMSKSLGNFVAIKDLRHGTRFGGRSWSGSVLRLAMLRTHYRQPVNWTVTTLLEAEAILKRLFAKTNTLPPQETLSPDAEVLSALQDDLNMPAAMARLHQIQDPQTLTDNLAFLGFHDALTSALTPQEKTDVEALIANRDVARENKNWQESDHIRDTLLIMGILIKDAKDENGRPVTLWEKKPGT